MTLTGPGGIGKTRLALQIASQLVEDFPHGVFIISLAPIADAALVSSVIAQVLEVGEVNNTPLIQSLQAHVRERAVFMLLDNFEQVVAAAPVVADLLEASPRLQVLATSRAPLHIRGEQEETVPPLGLPDCLAPPEQGAVHGTEALRPFEERARAVKPNFSLRAKPRC